MTYGWSCTVLTARHHYLVARHSQQQSEVVKNDICLH